MVQRLYRQKQLSNLKAKRAIGELLNYFSQEKPTCQYWE
jgi:hypothetical protein